MITLATKTQNEFAYQRAVKEIVSKNGWDLEALSHEAPTSWLGMVRAGLKSQFLPGRKLKGIVGDVLQMPGVFLLHEGRIVGDFKPQRVDKRPEYLEMAALEC